MAWWKNPGYLTLCGSFTASLLLMESPQANITPQPNPGAAHCEATLPCSAHSEARRHWQHPPAQPEGSRGNDSAPGNASTPDFAGNDVSQDSVEEYQHTERVGDFQIHSTYRNRFFNISASSSREIWQQLRGDSNPIAHTTASGTKPFAFSSWSYRYSYEVAFAADAASCSIRAGRIQFEFDTTLPRLQNEYAKEPRLRRQWDGLSSTIQGHEHEHQRIYSRAIRQIPQALESIRGAPCHLLDQRARAAVGEVVTEIKLASERLDSITDNASLAHAASQPHPAAAPPRRGHPGV